jgi:hypothetical protein
MKKYIFLVIAICFHNLLVVKDKNQPANRVKIMTQKSFVFHTLMNHVEKTPTYIEFINPSQKTLSVLLARYHEKDLTIKRDAQFPVTLVQLVITNKKDPIWQDDHRIFIEEHDKTLIIYKKTAQCFLAQPSTVFLPKIKID